MAAEVTNFPLPRQDEVEGKIEALCPFDSSEEDSGAPLHGSMRDFFLGVWGKLKIRGFALDETRLTLEFSLADGEKFNNDWFSRVLGVDLNGYLVGIREVDWEKTKPDVEALFGGSVFKVTLFVTSQNQVSEGTLEKVILNTRFGKVEIPKG